MAATPASEAGANFAPASGMTDAKQQSEHSDHVDFGSLAQLRDEIRLKMHLAQLDAKDKWQELETQLASLEHRVTADGGSILGSGAQLAKELKQSLVDFRHRLSPEPEATIPGASSR
jgi:hypothetical protein